MERAELRGFEGWRRGEGGQIVSASRETQLAPRDSPLFLTHPFLSSLPSASRERAVGIRLILFSFLVSRSRGISTHESLVNTASSSFHGGVRMFLEEHITTGLACLARVFDAVSLRARSSRFLPAMIRALAISVFLCSLLPLPRRVFLLRLFISNSV